MSLYIKKEKHNKQMNLRDWQERGWEYFKKHNNCIFEVATGSGKTFMAIHIIKELLKKHPNMKTLIVAPKNVILELTWMDELYNFGFPINKVGLYNQSAKEFSQITLVSAASLHKLIKTGIYDVFDFVIFDEVHNYASNNHIKKIKIPKKYKLGLTATFVRDDRLHIRMKHYFDYNIFKYDITEALKDNVLNQFEFYHINISMDDDVKEIYENLSNKIKVLYTSLGGIDFSKLKSDKKEHNILMKLINERLELINNYHKKKTAVRQIIKDNPTSKILVFNQYNKISTKLYWELQEDSVRCDIMNSTIPSYLRGSIFKDFEGDKLDVLLATTMLDEGYNLPKIDIAILMAQNSTDKQFIQRMGRVLRKKENCSKVFYLTVGKTYEEENFINKKRFIKSIAYSFREILL